VLEDWDVLQISSITKKMRAAKRESEDLNIPNGIEAVCKITVRGGD